LHADELVNVRIRADETVRGVLPPISTQSLVITTDQSAAAQELARHAPPERAAPIILIIAGAIAVVQLAQMVNEMVREVWYGGVIIDGRKAPPEITNDPRVPPNMVFLYQGDGTVRQFNRGELSPDILAAVLKGKK
jgi:hypothetical protein